MRSDPQAPPPSALDAATRALIRAKARQLAHRFRLPPTDVPDLEQDLALHVWTRLDHFDPNRQGDHGAFVRMLVGHAAATAFRARVRRTRHAPRSLDALLRGARCPDSPSEPADPRSGPGTELALSLDVAAVLAALPRPLRRVAEALKTRSVAAAARHLGLSRAALYRRLGALRAAFTAAGLEIFVRPRGHPARGRGSSLIGEHILHEDER